MLSGFSTNQWRGPDAALKLFYYQCPEELSEESSLLNVPQSHVCVLPVLVVSVAVTAQVMSVDERQPRGHRKTHQASRTHRDWYLWTHVTSEGNGIFLMLAYGFTTQMGYSEN